MVGNPLGLLRRVREFVEQEHDSRTSAGGRMTDYEGESQDALDELDLAINCLSDDPPEHRRQRFQAMHRRAQAAESRAIKAHRRAEFWADWATRRAMDEAGAPLLRQMVAELAESLAEAGVVPCVGSMNPHEDDLGRALVLVPSAKAGVDRIMNQLNGGEGED